MWEVKFYVGDRPGGPGGRSGGAAFRAPAFSLNARSATAKVGNKWPDLCCNKWEARLCAGTRSSEDRDSTPARRVLAHYSRLHGGTSAGWPKELCPGKVFVACACESAR